MLALHFRQLNAIANDMKNFEKTFTFVVLFAPKTKTFPKILMFSPIFVSSTTRKNLKLIQIRYQQT